MNFAPIDLGIFALFLCGLIALGASAKLRDSTMLQYLVAGRNLTLPAATATLVCTWYGGILGVGESAAFYGLGTWLMIGVPYYCFGMVYAIWLAPRVREAAQYSIPERMEHVFGRSMGSIAAVLMFLLAVPAAHMLMVGTLIQWLTAWPLLPSMLLAGLVSSLLLIKGGLIADVRISFLAFVAMFTGFGILALHSIAKEPISTVVAGLEPALQLPTGGQSWGMIVSFFILGAWTLADPGFHQRVASAATPEVGRKTVWASVGFWVLFDLLSITTALYALRHVPEGTPPLQLYPTYAMEALPPGMRAIFLCGIMGTILSALAGYSLVAGASLGRDALRAFKPSAPEALQKRAIQASIVLSTLVAIALGATVQSVVALWYSWAGVIIGALLVPLLIAYRSTSGSKLSGWAPWATLVGFGASLAWWIFGQMNNNPYLTIRLPDGSDFGMGTLLPGLFLTGTIIVIGHAVQAKKG